MLHEDRRMLKAYRAGEPWALERIYRAHAPRVAQILRNGFVFESQGRRCRYQGTRSEFELEDRLHEVFLRAFGESARSHYDGLRPFETYLSTITRNLVIDDFRSRRQALEDAFSIEDEETLPQAERGAPDEPLLGVVESVGRPEDDRARAEIVAHVDDFRQSLRAREAEVYRLRYQEELDIEEVAQRTKLSVSQVRTSEQRIRVGFFRFMRRHGYFEGWRQQKRGWLARIRGGLSIA